MLLIRLFAVESQVTDPLGGGAGWVGASLLGAVLFWLLYKHLPAKDAQLEKLIKDGNSRIDDLTTEHGKAMALAAVAYTEGAKEQRKDYKEALVESTTTFKTEAAAERAACERHFTTLAEAMGKGNEATIQAVRTMAEQVQQHALRNKQWSDLLAREIEQRKAAEAEKGKDS